MPLMTHRIASEAAEVEEHLESDELLDGLRITAVEQSPDDKSGELEHPTIPLT